MTLYSYRIWSLILFFAICLWIVGAILGGLKLGTDFPRAIRHYTNVAHLFPRRESAWSYFVVQARLAGGEGRWETLRLADYSGMFNYGYLTRLDRILDEAGTQVQGSRARRDLASYLAARHARLFPSSPAVREIRFLRVSMPVGYKGCAHPEGPWVTPILSAVPLDWVRQIQVIKEVEWSTTSKQVPLNLQNVKTK